MKIKKLRLCNIILSISMIVLVTWGYEAFPIWLAGLFIGVYFTILYESLSEYALEFYRYIRTRKVIKDGER